MKLYYCVHGVSIATWPGEAQVGICVEFPYNEAPVGCVCIEFL